MPIDLRRERTVNLSTACRELVPKFNANPVAPSTACRWINTGILAADGTRVRLEGVRVGRRMLTTEEAIERFFAELARRSGHTQTDNADLAVATKARLLAAELLPGQTSNSQPVRS